jgi:hypothetical protein
MVVLFKTYCPETGIVWKACEDMGGQGPPGPAGPEGPPAPYVPPGDVVEYLSDVGGALSRWDIIAIVNANGASPAVVTLPLALAGVVGMKATVLNVGTMPVLVETSDTPHITFDPIAPNDSAVFAPTNHGEVRRLLVSVVPHEKADVYAQRSDGTAFVPNNDVLTKVELWNATTNIGNHFDGATFVAPRNGTYAVSASVFTEWAAWTGGTEVRLCVVKNGTALFTSTWTPYLNGPSYYAPLNVACTVRCAAGDEVWIAMRTTRAGGPVALVANGYENTLSISEL